MYILLALFKKAYIIYNIFILYIHMKHIQKQKIYLLALWVTWVLLTGSILVSEIRLSDNSDTPSMQHYAPTKRDFTTNLVRPLLWCEDNNNQTTSFTTQAYRGEVYKDDSIWLMAHFKSAFTQWEWACWSNSLSTALYGQKNMINRFLQELEGIEKKKWKQANYDYVREQAKKLKEEAWKRNMNQGQWLDCYGSTQTIDCRALTNIDGLEALFPQLVNQVKARSNRWYTADDIYDFETWLSDWREFIDGTVNLSIPLNSGERWTPRWAQSLFREFVTRTFDAYDAQTYLGPKPWTQDPYFNVASTNPTLSNWKKLYVAYKEWLLDYKKFTPYVSNLEKMRMGTTTPGTEVWNATPPPPTTTRPTDPTTVTAPQPQRPTDPTKALPSNWATIITLPAKQAPLTPTTKPIDAATIKAPTSATTMPASGWSRLLRDTTPVDTEQQKQESVPTTSTTRTLRY